MVVIINGRVVGPHSVLEHHCVVIDGGRIKEIAPTAQVLWSEDTQVIDAGDGFVAPGFVDMHVHGALGRDTMDGTVEALAQIARFHAAGGTTAMTPTTTTHSSEKIAGALQAIADAMGHDFGEPKSSVRTWKGPTFRGSVAARNPHSLFVTPSRRSMNRGWIVRDW